MKAAPVISLYYTPYIGGCFWWSFLEKSCSDALSDFFLLFKLTIAYVYTHLRTYFEGAF